MFAALKAKWLSFWHNHVQKTFGLLLTGLAGLDLASALTGTDQYVVRLLGEKWNAGLHLVAAGLITLRATLARKSQALPPPASNTVRPTDVTKAMILVLLVYGMAATCSSHAAEVPIERNAPPIEGHPLTSVVVTQCNMIVAIYMTMPDGRLLRFDKSAALPASELMALAYSALRSERVEVSCNDVGAVGYEKHEPV